MQNKRNLIQMRADMVALISPSNFFNIPAEFSKISSEISEVSKKYLLEKIDSDIALCNFKNVLCLQISPQGLFKWQEALVFCLDGFYFRPSLGMPQYINYSLLDFVQLKRNTLVCSYRGGTTDKIKSSRIDMPALFELITKLKAIYDSYKEGLHDSNHHN